MTIPRVSHGRTPRATTVGPYTVTEAVYAPHQRVSRHEHGWPSWTLALEGHLIELAVATLRAQRARRAVGRTDGLNGVRDQLEAEFRAPPSLADLANARGVHPAYLCQAFRIAFGMGAGEFVRRVRFEWARDALRVGSAAIADIAFAAGFSDQAHLSRDFRKRAGMSPRQFRVCSRQK